MVGAEACTVFCGVADPALVVADLGRRVPLDPVEPGWTRVRATAPEGAAVLTRLMFAPRQQVLGHRPRHPHRGAPRDGAAARSAGRRVALLQTCDMILGADGEPLVAV